MIRFPFFAAAILLLCHCAAKHQPLAFAPYFATGPEDPFSDRISAERQALEIKGVLSLLEKKRLLELYQLEMRHLKSGPRYESLAKVCTTLAEEVRPLEKEVAEAAKENRVKEDPQPQPAVFGSRTLETLELRQLFKKTYGAWNDDANEDARATLLPVLNDPEWKNKVPPQDWFRLLQLDFRIALDIGDLVAAETRYQEMRAISDCAPETAEAAFALALYFFGNSVNDKALSLIQNQCDPDSSESNQMKKRYWTARFSGPQSKEALGFLDEAKKMSLPGFYQMLALSQGKENFVLKLGTEKQFLKGEMKVRSKVHKLWLAAEQRLQTGLRRDASVLLQRAFGILKEDSREKVIGPLLYTAHLFHAAGNHLEAMKVYSLVLEQAQKGDDAFTLIPPDFAATMFPKPFPEKVEWAAGLWGVDPDIVYALMRQESAFNPMAVSPADARGLLQLMPFVARALATRWKYDRYYSDRILFSANENLKLASFHLFQLQKTVIHPVLMAASYNAGYTRVARWWRRRGHLPLDAFIELIPIGETRNYAKLFVRNYLYYRAIRAGGTTDTALLDQALPPPPTGVLPSEPIPAVPTKPVS